MSEETQDATLLRPGVAAQRHGVSGAALRRMAAAYERVRGALPESSAGRPWPIEAVERLEQARALLAAGRAKSVQAALEAHDLGARVSVDAAPALRDGATALNVIAVQLKGVVRLKQHVEALGNEIEALKSKLQRAKTLPETTRKAATTEANSEHGLFFRFALWLERRLKGS